MKNAQWKIQAAANALTLKTTERDSLFYGTGALAQSSRAPTDILARKSNTGIKDKSHKAEFASFWKQLSAQPMLRRDFPPGTKCTRNWWIKVPFRIFLWTCGFDFITVNEGTFSKQKEIPVTCWKSQLIVSVQATAAHSGSHSPINLH